MPPRNLPILAAPRPLANSTTRPRRARGSRLTSPVGGTGVKVWFEGRGNGALTAREIFRRRSGTILPLPLCEPDKKARQYGGGHAGEPWVGRCALGGNRDARQFQRATLLPRLSPIARAPSMQR